MRLARTLLVPALLAAGCGVEKPMPERIERLGVTVVLVNGNPAPQPTDPPLLLPPGVTDLVVDVAAQRADGSVDGSYNGFVRLSVEPGTVVEVLGDKARGRNLLLAAGVAQGQTVRVRNARGETRVWAEDIGYVPVDPLAPPKCANGIDDDGDGDKDFPYDPGCAFANDDTETGGTYATGVSAPVRFELPRLADLQGLGAGSPYDQEGIEIRTEAPANLIVTRIASDGFYASDLGETRGFGHIFAFTFSTPGGLRVCDRITKLSGTSTEFFGFTELSFPSFDRHAWRFPQLDANGALIAANDGPCLVPEPRVLSAATTPPEPESATVLESLESALVRIENVVVGQYFGPEPATGSFGPTQSNCDLDNSGLIDFETPGSNEAACANACADDAQCVEWTGYVSRGNYRVVFPGSSCASGGGQRLCTMQINTRSVSQFDPPSMRGQPLAAVTGTLRNFSGGDLNWTIETRCTHDLVCNDPNQPSCELAPGDPRVNAAGEKAPASSQRACVLPRTTYENDATD